MAAIDKRLADADGLNHHEGHEETQRARKVIRCWCPFCQQPSGRQIFSTRYSPVPAPYNCGVRSCLAVVVLTMIVVALTRGQAVTETVLSDRSTSIINAVDERNIAVLARAARVPMGFEGLETSTPVPGKTRTPCSWIAT